MPAIGMTEAAAARTEARTTRTTMKTRSFAGRGRMVFLGSWQSVKGLGGIDKGTAVGASALLWVLTSTTLTLRQRVSICAVIAALMLTCWSTLFLPFDPPWRRRRAGLQCVEAVESCQCHSCHPLITQDEARTLLAILYLFEITSRKTIAKSTAINTEYSQEREYSRTLADNLPRITVMSHKRGARSLHHSRRRAEEAACDTPQHHGWSVHFDMDSYGHQEGYCFITLG